MLKFVQLQTFDPLAGKSLGGLYLVPCQVVAVRMYNGLFVDPFKSCVIDTVGGQTYCVPRPMMGVIEELQSS